MTDHRNITHDQAKGIVETVKEHDLVIQLDRMGATPYLKFTPYTNNRGVKVHMWSCISYTFRAMPERTLLNHPTIIKPEEYDDWEVRLITDEWVIARLMRTRIAKTKPVEDTPFAGGVVGGWTEEPQNTD